MINNVVDLVRRQRWMNRVSGAERRVSCVLR